ncbi:hypothetical protein PRVXT_000663 [Proteinivorax tanatarense]|uniref:Uncharacterized protein n=1 Tax=Proteinivorax tanatarense TaxID=1260629 RepID=A0AAU7VNL3_9FIRM
MDLWDVVVQNDFNNFSKKDIDDIIELLENNMSKDLDERAYLYKNMHMLVRNGQIRNLLNKRILAGRCSVKWLQIKRKTTINDLVTKLESKDLLFNKRLKTKNLEIKSPIIFSTIKLGDLRYLIRTIVPTGVKSINKGDEIEEITAVDNIVSIIDLSKDVLEVRSNFKNARVLHNFFSHLLELDFEEIDILKNFGGKMGAFKDSLDGGKFFDVNSKPILNLEITKEISNLLVNTLKALDNYFITKDMETLISEMQSTQIDEKEIGDVCFTQLLLAGLCKMNIGTDVELGKDLCHQSLYNLIKEHIEDETGYISFTFGGEQHTIQVGRTTNSISFRTMATEELIEYFASKVL